MGCIRYFDVACNLPSLIFLWLREIKILIFMKYLTMNSFVLELFLVVLLHQQCVIQQWVSMASIQISNCGIMGKDFRQGWAVRKTKHNNPNKTRKIFYLYQRERCVCCLTHSEFNLHGLIWILRIWDWKEFLIEYYLVLFCRRWLCHLTFSHSTVFQILEMLFVCFDSW